MIDNAWCILNHDEVTGCGTFEQRAVHLHVRSVLLDFHRRCGTLVLVSKTDDVLVVVLKLVVKQRGTAAA